jgi:hypothetical protein
MLAAELALVKASDRMFEAGDPPVEAVAVAGIPLVLKLLKTLAATELTTLMVSFARFVELEEPLGWVGETRTDPAELGTNPNVVKAGDVPDDVICPDVDSEGTQPCWRFASVP